MERGRDRENRARIGGRAELTDPVAQSLSMEPLCQELTLQESSDLCLGGEPQSLRRRERGGGHRLLTDS